SFNMTVPDTGQFLCYDWERIICDDWHKKLFDMECDSQPYCPEPGEDFYGQDGTYLINPPDLSDKGDNTIADNVTGLLWEQKTEDNEPVNYTFGEAQKYCEKLELGGRSDWRLPTRKEFVSLLNFGYTSPALDTEFFPYYSSADDSKPYYWTSSVFHDDPDRIWYIRLAFGLIRDVSKTDGPFRVKCVSGMESPAPNYIDNEDSTITDNNTGLMWEQKKSDGSDKDITFNWNEALSYCENLELAGYTDWRLPNTKELEQVLDLNKSKPAIDTTYFPNTQNGMYWTSTSCSGCHKMKAFSTDFTSGELYYGNKFRDGEYGMNYARAVRSADPDADGIVDPADNCPYTYNPQQEDENEDGVGDACKEGDTPTTTTSIMPTITQPESDCPLASVTGSNRQLETLRYIRDYRIKNIECINLIALYYRHGAEITNIISNKSLLKKQLKKVLVKNFAVAEELAGSGAAVMTQKSVEEIILLLQNLKAA
ncbi:MAG: DUF1566 domain-containing protein, partial [bacterium]|nr:DUF1566 domain-containing protein [bacterium]